MCRKTKKTIRWAAHRWTFRVSNPKVTWLWISRMLWVRLGRRRDVEEHQVDAGHGQHEEQEERQPPRQNVGELDRVLADTHRVMCRKTCHDRVRARPFVARVGAGGRASARRRFGGWFRPPAPGNSPGSSCHAGRSGQLRVTVRLLVEPPVGRDLRSSNRSIVMASNGHRLTHNAQRMQRSSSRIMALPCPSRRLLELGQEALRLELVDVDHVDDAPSGRHPRRPRRGRSGTGRTRC